jgi:hypothetical protein
MLLVELDPPKVEDFVYITDGTYDKEEVLKMEALMLNKLEFNLMVVTILDFVNIFLKGINADKITQDMANVCIFLSGFINCIVVHCRINPPRI